MLSIANIIWLAAVIIIGLTWVITSNKYCLITMLSLTGLSVIHFLYYVFMG